MCHHVSHMYMLTLHTVQFKLCYLNYLPRKPLGKSIQQQHWSHISCSFFTEKAAKWYSWLRKEKSNQRKQSYRSWNIPLQVDFSPIHSHSGRIPNKDAGIRHHTQSSWSRGSWSCPRTLWHVLWKDPGWLADQLTDWLTDQPTDCMTTWIRIEVRIWNFLDSVSNASAQMKDPVEQKFI